MANSLPRKPQFRQELRQRAHARAAFSSQSAKPRFWLKLVGGEHLGDWAQKDRNALLCQLNSYLPEKEGTA